jgi:hypothetical protein
LNKPTLKGNAVTGIGRGYDRVAGFYDLVVKLFFGNALLNIQGKALKQLPPVDHITIVGGGSGNILKVLFQQSKAKRYTYIEASDRMRTRAMHRLNAHECDRVYFSAAAPEDLKTDLIILPFVLDCYPDDEVEDLLRSAKAWLNAKGSILIVDFNLEERQGFKGGWVQRKFIGLLYAFFTRIGGSRTQQLAPIFSIADDLLGQGTQLEAYRKRWILARCYQMESK